MKKFNLILIIVSTLLLAQVASAASNYLVTESAPVYPGDTTYVYVPIQNIGYGSFMEDVTVKLVPKDNASANAVTILNDVDSLGTINDWGTQRTAKFRIYVNPDTIEGDYYFNVFITYKGQQTGSSNSQTTATHKLEDQILTIRGKPVIMLINSTIGIVAPTSLNTETLTFKNTGTGTVQNAIVEINLANTNSVFSILRGGKQFSLGTLKAGDVSSITFDLAVDIAARPGVYNIPVKITGQNNYSTDNIIGLVVAGITDFDISYVETLGSFSLNIANVGISSASAVAVSLPRQENFSVTGSSTSVIGNLNPGDYTSAIFQITKPAGAGNTLEFEIQYTDTSGQRHTMTKFLNVELSATGTQTKSTNTNYTTLMLAAVILIVIYWQRGKIKR
jgi:hypothetical protein